MKIFKYLVDLIRRHLEDDDSIKIQDEDKKDANDSKHLPIDQNSGGMENVDNSKHQPVNIIAGGMEDANDTQKQTKDENEEGMKEENLNIIEIEENIKSAIVKSFNHLNSNSDKASRLALKVFLLNDTIFNSLCLVNNSEEFIMSLKEKIDTELGITFKSIQIFNKKPSGEKQLEPVKDSNFSYLYYTLEETLEETTENTKPEVPHNFATITALKGYGSILNDIVKMQPNPQKVYCIGRGEKVKTNTGTLRINHIVIDNDEQCKEYENNKYVSSNHAHIQYMPGIGFVLFVDQGGRRINGNRTRIIRDGLGDPIDLGSDTKNPISLKNGDIIELGKHVLLEFRYS